MPLSVQIDRDNYELMLDLESLDFVGEGRDEMLTALSNSRQNTGFDELLAGFYQQGNGIRNFSQRIVEIHTVASSPSEAFDLVNAELEPFFPDPDLGNTTVERTKADCEKDRKSDHVDNATSTILIGVGATIGALSGGTLALVGALVTAAVGGAKGGNKAAQIEKKAKDCKSKAKR
jgi:hypothetical protein